MALGGCKDDVGGGSGAAIAFLEAPANLAGVAQNGGTEIALTWTDNSNGETGYRVEVDDGPFGAPPYIEVAILAADSVAYVHRTLPNTTRHFRVFSVTASAESAPSNVVTVTTPDVPLAPAYLTGLVTEVLVRPPVSATHLVDVRWLNPSGTTGNALEFSGDGGTTWTSLAAPAAGPGVSGMVHTVNQASGEFLYRVYAMNANGSSAPSPVARVSSQVLGLRGNPLYRSIGADDVGLRASIALSPGGVEHVSHYGATTSDLFYTAGTMAGTHSTSMVDDGGTGLDLAVGYEGTSIGVDASGRVHLAAHEYWGGVLRYATNESGSFAASTVDSDGAKDLGKGPKLRVSPSDGSIQIVYREEGTGGANLRRIVRSGGSWGPPQSLLALPDTLGPHSFALDSSGQAHVVFVRARAGGAYDLVHALSAGAGWQMEIITSVGQPDHNDVAVTPGGVIHVSYHDASTGSLMYAARGGGAWSIEEVHRHTTGNLGRHNAIALDPATGRVNVAYYDAVNGNLWYAYRDPAPGWVLRLLDWSGDVGRYASIAANGGEVHIACYDVTNGDLRLLVYTP